MSTEAFLIIFISFWAIISLVPLLFKQLKVPSVIVLLVMGMVIGPNGLGLLNFLATNLNFLGIDPEIGLQRLFQFNSRRYIDKRTA